MAHTNLKHARVHFGVCEYVKNGLRVEIRDPNVLDESRLVDRLQGLPCVPNRRALKSNLRMPVIVPALGMGCQGKDETPRVGNLP